MKVILKDRVHEETTNTQPQHLDYIGDDGYVYRYNIQKEKYIRTDLSINGKSGGTVNTTSGLNGKDGLDGKDGETPYIGNNGNWFIGDVDTGVKAELDASIYATKEEVQNLIIEGDDDIPMTSTEIDEACEYI